MADDLFTDSSTAIEEPGWGGGGGAVDFSGDAMHIRDPAERRAYKKRRGKWRAKWARAQAVRETWTPADFEAERLRLEQEVAAMMEAREGRHHAA